MAFKFKKRKEKKPPTYSTAFRVSEEMKTSIEKYLDDTGDTISEMHRKSLSKFLSERAYYKP